MSTASALPGLIYGYLDVGTDVTEAEFHDWLNNEHIPNRMALPIFRTATRWVADDGLDPKYLTTYDITSCFALTDPTYTALHENQRARKDNIMARVRSIDRRIYEALAPPPDDSPQTNGSRPPDGAFHELVAPDYDTRAPGPYLVAVKIAVKIAMKSAELEGELVRWYSDEHIPLLARVPGWRRSRRFVLREFGPPMGKEAATLAARGAPGRFLAVHEWASPAAFETAEYRAARSTEWRARVVEGAAVWERRRFKEMRTWVREDGR